MAKQATNFRLPKRTIEMMDEICVQESIDSRAVLIERLVDHYYHFGTLAERIADHERRIETLEANQAVQAKNQPNSIL